MPIEVREVRERLLDLFPAETIRAFPQVDEAMTKAEGIAAVAAGADLNQVREFLERTFGRLHQHVHIFERDPADGRAPNVGTQFGVDPFAVRVEGGERHHFYLLPLTYDLVLDAPLERSDLTFAWPLKLVIAQDHVRVHFTIMAKKPQAHVEDGRAVVKSVQRPTEGDLLVGFPASLGLAARGPLDFNRGIKALWDADEFDAPTVQYKRARATSKDVMDEAFTVKAHDPDLYAELADKPLYQTTLLFMGEDPCIKYLVVDPTQGTLVFRRYSSSNDCVDGVIRRILAAN